MKHVENNAADNRSNDAFVRLVLIVGLILSLATVIYLNLEGRDIGVAAVMLFISISISITSTVLLFEQCYDRAKKAKFSGVVLLAIIGFAQFASIGQGSYQKREVLLGSSVDSRKFYFKGRLISEGFAADVSTDLPVAARDSTQTKFGFAVAGLANSWSETIGSIWYHYTPYVKEMRFKVEGSYGYTVYDGSIFDNTGTGGSSIDYFNIILKGLELALNAYSIYTLLREIYQQPPVAEWNHGAHWTQAIVRQKVENPWWLLWRSWVNPNNPRLQTAGAYVLSYFDNEGPNILNVIAEADIYVQVWCISDTQGVIHQKVGTYTVSFSVSVPVGVYDLTVRTYLANGNPIFDVGVWIDDEQYYS